MDIKKTDVHFSDYSYQGFYRPDKELDFLRGDLAGLIPGSPDIDPFEDGFETYVVDFDKMRKTHIYDWRWADVAVFDYNAETRK